MHEGFGRRRIVVELEVQPPELLRVGPAQFHLLVDAPGADQCRVEPLDMARHGDDLVAAFRATDEASWVYLFVGPFADDAGMRAWLTDAANSTDYVYSAIIDRKTGHAGGVCAYMRPDPSNGVIEIGSIHYSDALKRTPATTEAMYLLMRHVFDDLGYRRYEWKCNSLNTPSRRTALRLGFRFEGKVRSTYINSEDDHWSCDSWWCDGDYYGDSQWYTAGEATAGVVIAF